jgi:anti-anti-sigma factor
MKENWRIRMAIEKWSNDTLLVNLPGEPELQEALVDVAERVRDCHACDVVMDFSAVTLLTSSCLATLLRLRKELVDHGRHLVLCNITRPTHGILAVTGLIDVFEISDDRLKALAKVQNCSGTVVFH